MNRRVFLAGLVFSATALLLPHQLLGSAKRKYEMADKIVKTDQEWKDILTPEQFNVLRKAGTERPFSSVLNKEYGDGEYVCAACELPLFESNTKFDSGTGWPSFYQAIDGHTETKRDFKMIFPRTEYHCVRCGGHQGHIFQDGPAPTGQRWCNNGVALKFIPI
ncbi:MAG: peptide-methionine (R)-S-oxide reductase MsrB [Mariprofundaceae bacterium]|nr:peptide-methionine (R)-S-oxide reductase MsrB [Mariprofundaceae bacterium]